jgi:alkylated DNA repair protein alkB family protein 7
MELDISDDNSVDKSDVKVREVIGRIRRHLEKTYFDNNETTTKKVQWLPCHAIDLRKDGILSPHVDSVRFSGDIVAGLSLQSASIMRLKPVVDTPSSTVAVDGCHVDLYLPPLSLYVLTGVSRYNYTHELLSSGEIFHLQQSNECIQVDRQDRISIIFRDAPPLINTPPFQGQED